MKKKKIIYASRQHAQLFRKWCKAKRAVQRAQKEADEYLLQMVRAVNKVIAEENKTND